MCRKSPLCVVIAAAAAVMTPGTPSFAAGDTKQTTIHMTPKRTKLGAPDEKTLRKAIQIIEQRLKNAGVKNSSVKLTASKQIEVSVPSGTASWTSRIKSLVSRKGSLEIALLANMRDHAAIILQAKEVKEKVRINGRIVASWKTVAVTSRGKPVDIGTLGQVATRISKTNGTKLRQFLVVHSKPQHRLSELDLVQVRPSVDAGGSPAILFRLSKQGGSKMEKLTGDNVPVKQFGFRRRLCVLLDDRLVTAPSIITKISAEGQITGMFSAEEAMEMVSVLNVHRALPFTIETISVKEAVK